MAREYIATVYVHVSYRVRVTVNDDEDIRDASEKVKSMTPDDVMRTGELKGADVQSVVMEVGL